MARRAFRSGVVLQRGQKRATSWIASADSTGITNLAAGAAILDQSFTEAVLQAGQALPSTIIRTRGTLWVQSDQIANIESPFGALGFSVNSEQARVAGVASLPTPINEEGSDLFFLHLFWQAAFTVVSAVGTGGSEQWSRYDFDSKAMRKIETGNSINVTLENASSSHGAAYILKYRMLLKLV